MSKNFNKSAKKQPTNKPVMTPRKKPVTPQEKKAQWFRVGFVLVLLALMIATPAFINWLTRRNLDIDWLPTTGTSIITNDEMAQILEDDSDYGIFIYLGMASCPACQQFEPILHATLAELGLGLRHFQLEDAMDEDQDVATELLAIISERATASWRDRGGVPVIKLFHNGRILDYLVGVQSQEAIINFFERNGGLD